MVGGSQLHWLFGPKRKGDYAEKRFAGESGGNFFYSRGLGFYHCGNSVRFPAAGACFYRGRK